MRIALRFQPHQVVQPSDLTGEYRAMFFAVCNAIQLDDHNLMRKLPVIAKEVRSGSLRGRPDER
jgi:hypothetical protein